MLAAALFLAVQSAASPPPAPPPPACATPQHRQFDFWVGSWDVYPTGTNQLVAHSLIERRYNGCAIRENWMPLRGQGGGSFSAWRAGADNWRQTWVDSNGSYWHFVGGHDEAGDVCFTTPGAVDADRHIKRMVFTGIAPDAFAWRWESSPDAVTWTPPSRRSVATAKYSMSVGIIP